MASALKEFLLRLEDIEASAEFSKTAAMLRPRAAAFFSWPEQDEHKKVRALAVKFFDAKTADVTIVYGALFVRIGACFERFARDLKKLDVTASTRPPASRAPRDTPSITPP